MTWILILAASLAWADISFESYAGFEEKWKMITVRYRSDTKEQRFVWANPIAAEALLKGASDFPDGAVFAKIGFAVEEDPAFPSSMVPSGSKRYQFMVRDKSKYKDTGGWGYALFDGEKRPSEGDSKAQAQACYACHQLVPNRGQVFSQPLRFEPNTGRPTETVASATPQVSVVKFEDIQRTRVPNEIRKFLPDGKFVRSVKGELRKYVFRGTIDEIRPSLIEEAKRTGRAAALISEDSAQFAAVFPTKNKTCGKRSYKSVFSLRVPSREGGDYQVVANQDLCL